MKKRSLADAAGFTLIEMATVIGILAVAFIPLTALLPSGLRNFRRAMDLSITTQIAQQVVNDAQQGDFDYLIDRKNLKKDQPLEGFTFRAPRIHEPGLRYFDEQGAEILPEDPKSLTGPERSRVIYQVNTRVQPQASVPSLAGSKLVIGTHANLAKITVQVASAPRARPLTFSPAAADDLEAPDRNLIQPEAGVEIYTFTTFVGRGL